MRETLRRLVPLLIIGGILAYFGFRYYEAQMQSQPGTLKGSGSIETTEVTVSSETTGRILAVLAIEGQAVKAGQTLVRFDDAVLKAQRRQAQAAAEAAQGQQAAAEATQAAAQANLDQLKAGSRPQEIEAEKQAVAAAQGRAITAQGQLEQARGALQAAQAARDQAVAAFAQVKQGARPEQIDAAAVAFEQADAAVRKAQSDYDKVKGLANAGALPQAVALQQATLAMQAAKSNYQGVLAGATTPELDQARAGVNQAVAGIIQASATVSQTEAALSTAQAGLAGEQARLDLMQAGTRPEQIRVAEAQVAAARAQAEAAASQVAAAQATVALIDEQLSRLTIKAPSDGVVLTRAVEPGEVGLPGGTLVILGDLGRLTITVYLPEDRYGAVKVGDQARITVDSFPGQNFVGTVERVADQAEFTPRNVQTTTGRQTTVFAVKIAVANPEGKLKPGMPADVVFAK
jgi:HlyD family secretion protein